MTQIAPSAGGGASKAGKAGNAAGQGLHAQGTPLI